MRFLDESSATALVQNTSLVELHRQLEFVLKTAALKSFLLQRIKTLFNLLKYKIHVIQICMKIQFLPHRK
jgi:hypothetical protein